jgi:hypothetical protein
MHARPHSQRAARRNACSECFAGLVRGMVRLS